tara:strand:- start:14289 stop:15617 length:1329 start_codon:yes stop_codon:yes gene_type:complete
MSDRSKTIWNLILVISLFSIIASGFQLFPLNNKYKKIYNRSKNLQFGTDQELENVISFLEKRLEVRNSYRFDIQKEPMLLTNVLSIDGSGRRSRRNKSAIRVALVYQRQNNFQAQIDYRGQVFGITVGEEIENVGNVLMIDQNQVVIKHQNRVTSYPAPGVGDGLPKELNNFPIKHNTNSDTVTNKLGSGYNKTLLNPALSLKREGNRTINVNKERKNIAKQANVEERKSGEKSGIKTASGGEKTSVQLIAVNPNSLVEKMFNSAIEKKNDQSPNKNKPIPDILESVAEPVTKVKTVKKPPVDYDIPFWPSPVKLQGQNSLTSLKPLKVSEKSNKKSLNREKNANPKLDSIKKVQAKNKRVFPTWKHELQALLGLPKPAINGNPSLMSFNELKALLQTQSGINDSIFKKSYKEVGFDDFQKFLDQNSEQIINFVRNSNSRTL